ncbi:hypothetical protein ACFFRR_009338 [Megaselia abdita]
MDLIPLHNHESEDDEGMDHDMGGGMSMSFHAGYKELILWNSWKTETILTFVLSCIGIFLIAVLYEGLKFMREKHQIYITKKETELMARINKNRSEMTSEECCSNTTLDLKEHTVLQRVFNKSHLLQTFMHIIQMIISYLLMLIVMTYNYWLFLSVILGSGMGYFVFGWIRERIIDCNEHCH